MPGNPFHLPVLLVDDDAFQLKILTALLSDLGYTNIASYTSSVHALESFREKCNQGDDSENAICFLDLSMPEMDGIEFVRHLVDIGYVGSLVLISGEDERILASANKLATAHGLRVLGDVAKPATRDIIVSMIDKWSEPVHRKKRPPRKVYEAQEILAAITRNQMETYFQPKIAMKDGSVASLETLVRWNHPTDGLVFPDQFIQTAEESGLIADLTDAILTMALRQAEIWRGQGLRMGIAVNVSMDNLTDLNFPRLIQERMTRFNTPPGSLILEVTESRLTKDPNAALEILTRLRLKQVELSIDDFGTGHSSLAQLRDLPFSELKLDRSFVHGASQKPAQRAIVESNLTLARDLGIKSVAEGVEDKIDWDFLKERDCDMVQGYLIARPMPAGEFIDWNKAWKLLVKELIPS